MAAIASAPIWNPEDDILLKKSVEAGASLEALAKGAVQFSRKFSVKELRSRWHSLLYDSGISSEASARMFEYDLSDSPLFPRVKLSENHNKESVESPGKRKSGSIHNHYYTLRKKFRAHNVNSSKRNHLATDVCDCDNNICSEFGPLREGQPENYLFQEDVLGHYKVQNACAMPHYLLHAGKNIRAGSGDNDVFHSDEDNSLGEILTGGLFDYSENVSSVQLDSLGKNERKQSSGERFLKEPSHTGADSFVKFQNCVIEETGQSSARMKENMVEANGLGNRSVIHNNLSNIGHRFERTELSSLRLTWRTNNDASAISMACNFNVRDRAMDPGMEVAGSGNNDSRTRDQDMHFSCDLIHPRLIHDGRHFGDGMHSSTVLSESEFVDLSDSLLNLDDEDLLFIRQISEDNFDTAINHSSKDSPEADRPALSESQRSISATSNIHFTDSVCPSPKMSDACTSRPSIPASCDDRNGSNSESSGPQSMLLTNTFSPDFYDRVCTLNTEDTDIPNNDDIIFPIQAKIFLGSHSSKSSCEPISSPTVFIKRNEKDLQGFINMKNSGSLGSIKNGCSNQLCRPAARFKLSANNDALESKCAADHGCSTKENPNSTSHRRAEITSAPVPLMDFKTHSEDLNRVLKASPLMDVDDYESEDDIPCYSDIEAMILEMDLGPYDQEHVISDEVSRFQNESSKRRIIRLEQCAYSYLRRALAVKNALAILYGRHVKYHIKKAEVVLGRATDDINVDIDLGKEGPANKISRRQAIINLEENGSFYLKNLGRSSIYINGKEIGCGNTLVLVPNCLIEIRDLNFVFEANYKSVTRFLLREKNRQQVAHCKWSVEGDL